MKPQTHSTIRNGKRLVWLTEKLWEQAEGLNILKVRISDFPELDMDCWFGKGYEPTLRKISEHCQRINAASLDYPIILNSDGSLMDGGHRLCKALILGHKTIDAVQFESMPKPDQIIELDK